MSVCWYYRAEQTIHPVHRVFWDHEVFKTSKRRLVDSLVHWSNVLIGHFADHSLDDLIERIAVQFTARHIRGRPRPPYWHPGWPLYICDSRYNDRERCFVKIKNWSSCVPEEVRKRQDWMPIFPFERHVYPCRFPSPFVKGRGVKGPGSIGDSVERGEGEKIEGGGTGRKRTRKGGSGTSTITDTYGPNKGLYVGSPQYAPKHPQSAPASTQYQYAQQSAPQQHHPSYGHQAAPPPPEDRSIVHAAGGTSMAGTPDLKKLPSEMGTSCLQNVFCLLVAESCTQSNISTVMGRRTSSCGSLHRR
jgi:chromatin structure-remodeling complex subunit RSC1/2